MIDGLIVTENKSLPIGYVVLLRNSAVVWMGNLSDPWSDVECDTIIVSSSDYAKLKASLVAQDSGGQDR